VLHRVDQFWLLELASNGLQQLVQRIRYILMSHGIPDRQRENSSQLHDKRHAMQAQSSSHTCVSSSVHSDLLEVFGMNFLRSESRLQLLLDAQMTVGEDTADTADTPAPQSSSHRMRSCCCCPVAV
jgi:hypothetical protein